DALAEEPVIEALARLLRHPDAPERAAAARAAGPVGDAAARRGAGTTLLRALADLLRDPVLEVREAALDAVSRMPGALGEARLPDALLDRWRHGSATERRTVGRTLEALMARGTRFFPGEGGGWTAR